VFPLKENTPQYLFLIGFDDMIGNKFWYETHMHTSEVSRCAVNTAAEQVRAYKDRGYAGIIITDHFVNGYSTCPRNAPWDVRMKHIISGYTAAKTEGDILGLDVFLGWEFTVKGSDFLTYGLDLDFLVAHPRLDKLSVEKYSALVRENGGYIAQAHPYRDAYYIENKWPVDPKLLDGVEIFNASDSASSNKRALNFATEHDLSVQAGSDSHSVQNHFSSGIKLKQKAKNIHDIIEALKAKEVTLVLP